MNGFVVRSLVRLAAAAMFNFATQLATIRRSNDILGRKLRQWKLVFELRRAAVLVMGGRTNWSYRAKSGRGEWTDKQPSIANLAATTSSVSAPIQNWQTAICALAL